MGVSDRVSMTKRFITLFVFYILGVRLSKAKEEMTGRINLLIPKSLDDRLNQYIVKIVKQKGKIPHAIRTKIARKALEEWLDKHESDFDIIK
jgi:hypothetical protein